MRGCVLTIHVGFRVVIFKCIRSVCVCVCVYVCVCVCVCARLCVMAVAMCSATVHMEGGCLFLCV